MPAIRESARVCENCGSPVETTSSGDLGCMVCLIDVGLDVGADKGDRAFASVPDQLGAYTIEHHADGGAWELGRGAMGITYRAIDKVLDRPVALKIINTNLGSRSAEARERFLREVRAAAALRHPNVATVYQFGVREETGQFFYAMELVEGETLEERVGRFGPLDVLAAIDVALQVTAALAAAEQHGLVHRDLKPGNLMFVSAGEAAAQPLTVKVIDFGVAKAAAEKTNAMSLTQGGFVGTPAFASPEQFTDAPVDVRSDIYSLGATLWFLLTGHMLFSGRTIEEIRDARRAKPLPIEQLKAARVPGRFISLLTSMLAIEPAARPAGASELTAKLQAIRNSITGRSKVIARLAIAAALVAFAIVAVIWNSHRQSTATVVPIPEKSIAVLPFENFSDDKENAYFADGVQDEILTDLTKVADLKVISRRSVAQYRDTKQSVREIGRALGVAHVLAGTVRKAAGRLHVTVQLIDAHNEAETWAEKYDRDVADVFLIQSDISQEIVSRLKVALSPSEKAAIEEKPTQDKEAYDLYLRARALIYGQVGVIAKAMEENATKAIPLLESAIARDPKFTLAYCVLGDCELILHNTGTDQDKSPLVKAKAAIDTAVRISPNSGEAHLILARYFIEHIEDIPPGEKELAIAAAGLPGRVDVFSLRALAEQKRGQWKEALRDREKAAELDPRDGITAEDLASFGYLMLRRYADAERVADHWIATTPQQSTDSFWRVKSSVAIARGDVKAAMTALDSSPNRNVSWDINLEIANVFAMERDYTKAEEVLQFALQSAEQKIAKTRKLYFRACALEKLGRVARFRGDKEKARGYFEAARAAFEEWLAENNPEDHSFVLAWLESHSLAYIAEIDAALGRKEDAIREGRKSVALWPLKRDARLAPNIATLLAIVYLWSGERDAALEQLAQVAKLPKWAQLAGTPAGMMSAGELKLDPLWDELRNDPRFDKIIAETAKPIKLD